MTSALLIQSLGGITDSAQPSAKKDRILNSGSILLADLANPYCIDLTGPIIHGQAVHNLVDGAANGTLNIPAPGDLVAVAGRGIQLAASVRPGRIQFPALSYFQTNLADNYLIIVWATYPGSDPGGGNIGMMMSKGGATLNFAQSGPFIAARFNGGAFDQPAKFDNGANNGNTLSGTTTPAGKHQFAIAKSGTAILHFRDGVQIGSSSANLQGNIVANSNPLDWGNTEVQYAVPGQIMHRLYIENVTVSGVPAATVVANDYAQNSARFV